MLQNQIRDLIKQQPCSVYRIAKLSDINKSSMSRFMNGKSLSGQSLDRISIVLGLELQATIQNPPRTRGWLKS